MRRALGGVLTVVLAVGVVGGIGALLHRGSVDQGPVLVATDAGTVQTPRGTMHHATIELGVYPDAVTANVKGGEKGQFPWYVAYGPSTNLVLPAHSYVTMTIKAYDSGEKLNNPFFGKVIGTADGTMTVNGQTVNSIASDNVEHTFTLHSLITNQDPLFVNIPLMRQPDAVMNKFDATGVLPKPIVTTFSFYTGGPGEYVFNCEYPCGDGTYRKFGAAMAQYGYMSGKVTVA